MDDENYDSENDEVTALTGKELVQKTQRVEEEEKEAQKLETDRYVADQRLSVMKNKLQSTEISQEDQQQIIKDLKELKMNRNPETMMEVKRRLIKKRRKAIYARMNKEQRDRYSSFKQSSFAKVHVKKLMMQIMGTTKVSDLIAFMMSGVTKIFVADLVESALMIMKEWNSGGPIRPVHLREAYRRIKLEGNVPSANSKKLPRL